MELSSIVNLKQGEANFTLGLKNISIPNQIMFVLHTTENCVKKLKHHILGNPDRKEVEIVPHTLAQY